MKCTCQLSRDSNVCLDRGVDPRRGSSTWKDDFQEAYDRVENSVQRLLHGWLQDPRTGKQSLRLISPKLWLNSLTDAEAAEFNQIRVACLPEVVLAYIAVLDSSSRFLSRDLLLRGMDLAAVIAAEDSDLATCFMVAGRMPELVDAFACVSKTMVQADDLGPKGGKSRKKKNGETLGLWSVRAPSP